MHEKSAFRFGIFLTSTLRFSQLGGTFLCPHETCHSKIMKRLGMALLDILDCSIDELIEPFAQASSASARPKKAVGAENGIGDLRPKRARIRDAGRP